MKPSQYNIYFDFNNKSYIYNTLSSAILAVPENIITSLKDNAIQRLDSETCLILNKNGVLVDIDADETSIYEYYYNSVQYNSATEELRLVILPTYQCNLRCSYCFEDCKDLNFKLDNKKIEQIGLFTENELCAPLRVYKKISLTLFGGEPLIYKEECISLTNKLRDIADKYILDFESKIITNATLIEEDLIKRLILPNKMRIQITLDGDKEIHNERRIYKSGRGSFEQIQNAILLLNQYGCKELIDLRLNIDKNNLTSVETVFKEFHNLCDYMYIGLLRAVGNNSCHTNACISDNDYMINIRPKLKPIYEKYKKELHYIPFGKKRPCALNRPNSFIIDANLDVYKCDNLVGARKHSVGQIVEGKLIKTPQYYNQLTWSPFHSETCRKCKLLPVCASDCAYRCLLYTNSMNNHHCALTESELIEKLKLHIADKTDG